MSDRDKKLNDELNWRKAVFDSLSFPTLVLSPNREIVSANQNFLNTYMVRKEDIKGTTCHELLFGSQEPCAPDICPLAQLLKDKKGHSILKKIIGSDGHEEWEDRVFSPILDDQGEVAFILESFRDVTRLKTLEKTLKQTEDFLDKLVQSSASAILAADKNGEILIVNAAAEELFGYTLEQAARGITVEDIYPPGVAKEIMRKLRDKNVGGKGKLPATKTTIINRSGEEIPVEMTASIIYEGETETASMGIYNDLREKVAVERQLQETRAQLAQTEKMASLGQLAAGVAHEINNPLTGILFYVNLILEDLTSENPIKEDLEYVIEDVHRCKDIVKNLLAYSRQQYPTKDIIQLNDLVCQSLTLIRDQRMFASVKLEKILSEDLMLVHVDRSQFNQVIINLVMNAVAAMDGQGVLTLKTYRNKPAQKVLLEVADTGCGIPEEHLSKIFDPFFTTKAPGQGTGLGLSTVYGIVHENGGNITIKQTGPQGTTFLLELPLFQARDENVCD